MRRKLFAASLGLIVMVSMVLAGAAYITSASGSVKLPDRQTAPIVSSRVRSVDPLVFGRDTGLAYSAASITPLIPTPTPSPIARATVVPPGSPESINGVPIEKIAVVSPAVAQHVRQIYAAGQKLGRNGRAFVKIGDSTMVWPALLADFEDRKAYNLASFAYLQPTIDLLRGSLGRSSLAAIKGMHTWTEFDPTWADKTLCHPGEGPLQCEIRVFNPSIAIIRLGANDSDDPARFGIEMRRIVNYCITSGVIPIIGTKPDQREGPQNSVNQIVRQIAVDYNIPLWDYEVLAATVPNRGLEDDVHIKPGDTHDFTLARTFQSGDALGDLSALIALDVVLRSR
jgi:hypothetical protein